MCDSMNSLFEIEKYRDIRIGCVDTGLVNETLTELEIRLQGYHTLTVILFPNFQTQHRFVFGLIAFGMLLRPSEEFRMHALVDNIGLNR